MRAGALNRVVWFVGFGHSSGFSSVPLSFGFIINSAQITWVNIQCCGRIAYVSEARECTFFPEILFSVRSSVDENDQILFVVRVRPFDQPDTYIVVFHTLL